MKKAKRKSRARRKRAARSSGVSVGSMLKRIAKMFQIPRQAIMIVGPNRRRVAAQAKIAKLRAAWD